MRIITPHETLLLYTKKFITIVLKGIVSEASMKSQADSYMNHALI